MPPRSGRYEDGALNAQGVERTSPLPIPPTPPRREQTRLPASASLPTNGRLDPNAVNGTGGWGGGAGGYTYEGFNLVTYIGCSPRPSSVGAGGRERMLAPPLLLAGLLQNFDIEPRGDRLCRIFCDWHETITGARLKTLFLAAEPSAASATRA